MFYPPGFYFVKKPKRFVILSSDKSSERNLSSFFDIKNPRKIEHLQSGEPFSSDPYFRYNVTCDFIFLHNKSQLSRKKLNLLNLHMAHSTYVSIALLYVRTWLLIIYFFPECLENISMLLFMQIEGEIMTVTT